MKTMDFQRDLNSWNDPHRNQIFAKVMQIISCVYFLSKTTFPLRLPHKLSMNIYSFKHKISLTCNKNVEQFKPNPYLS